METIKIIDEMIAEQKKHFSLRRGKNSREVCWLCFENDECSHEPAIAVLEELKKRLA